MNEIMFTVSEVESAIQKSNSGKSPGEYGLCAEHWKYGNGIISKRLTSIVHILSPETDNCPS